MYFPTIISGLTEGCNPCAVLVLFLFIFFLLISSLTRLEAALFGTFFILSSLGTSFSLGFGMLAQFRGMEIFFILSKSFYFFLVVLAVVAGISNFYDWIVYRRTLDAQKFILTFPRLGRQVNGHQSAPTPKDIYFYINLVLGAGILGFVVVLFQAGSRGQVFLPGLTEMMSSPELKNQAVFFMALYSAMFILPLWVSLSILLGALKSPRLIERMNRYVSKVKIISAAVFLGVGLGLVPMFTN